MRIAVINGPNLNLLGTREPEIYGVQSFDSFIPEIELTFPEIDFVFYQSNIEGEIINKLQDESTKSCGIILNAGGYSHTSVAIADAVAAIKAPVIDVHLSNIFAREDYRRFSLTGSKSAGSIHGFGLFSYILAVLAIRDLVSV